MQGNRSQLTLQQLESVRESLRKLAREENEDSLETVRLRPAALIQAFIDDDGTPDTTLSSFIFYLMDNLNLLPEDDLNVNLALSDLDSFASWSEEKTKSLGTTLQNFAQILTDGIEPLFYASEHGLEAVVKLILSTDGVKSMGDYDPEEPQPLSLAARNGHETVVNLLLTIEDIDVNHREESWGGQTALSSAAENGHEAVVKLLLAVPGIDPNIEDWDYKTPMLLAARAGNDAIVDLLLLEGVDPNFKNYWGETPLLVAAELGHEAVIKRLLSADNINPHVENSRGENALSAAAELGHTEIVKILLTAIDAGSKDSNGNTPL